MVKSKITKTKNLRNIRKIINFVMLLNNLLIINSTTNHEEC